MQITNRGISGLVYDNLSLGGKISQDSHYRKPWTFGGHPLLGNGWWVVQKNVRTRPARRFSLLWAVRYVVNDSSGVVNSASCCDLVACNLLLWSLWTCLVLSINQPVVRLKELAVQNVALLRRLFILFKLRIASSLRICRKWLWAFHLLIQHDLLGPR